MKLEFKQDFFKKHFGNISAEEIDFLTRITNQCLAEMLASAPVVYGDIQQDGFANYWTDSKLGKDYGAKKALLINIQPIVKEPCRHEPTEIFYSYTGNTYYCKCGVELVAEWKVK